MSFMYIARFARQDLLRAVGALTTMITRGDEMCDRKLLRIISYMKGSAAWRQIRFIGDTPDEPELGLFSDADFAGDRADMRITSGAFLALYGPRGLFPLSGLSKKQTAVSHSTVEDDIVAASHALRTSGLPALELWDKILSRSNVLQVHLDNQATARIMTTGRALALRYIERTHSVSICWLNERVFGSQSYPSRLYFRGNGSRHISPSISQIGRSGGSFVC